MKSVLIDLTQVPVERTGVGIYALNYVKQLGSTPVGLRLHLLVQDDDAEMLAHAEAIPGATIYRINARLFRRFLFRVLLEQILIPLLVLRKAIDAVHSLHYSFPLMSFGKFKRIVTVCDMTFFLFPELHVRVKRVFFRFFIRRLPRVDGLLYISASTRRDFRQLFPHSTAAECVAPLGVDLASLEGSPDEAVVADLQRRLGANRFILYVGTIEPRKNILGVVRAFERIAESYPDLKLVIAGKRGWGYEILNKCIAVSPIRDRIVLLGYVDDAQKHALFKSATLFAYVSFYEGFGLPVLEGMAAGVATITSNTSSLPEVAGDGALQVDPNDFTAIAGAMKTLLDSAQTRAQVARRGIRQSRIFTWKNMTARSLDFYQQLLAGS